MFQRFIKNHGPQRSDYSSQHTLKGCLQENENGNASRKPANIKVPEEQYSQKTCFVVNHVLSQVECHNTIQRAEEAGFQPALVNIGGGEELLMKDYRLSDRCIIDDDDFAREIFNRIQHALPQMLDPTNYGSMWKLTGLNRRMRILKYGAGHFFAEHRDGCYSPNANECSFLTVMIYLNDGGGKDFVGGCTNFVDPPKRDKMHRTLSEVVPQIGRVLVFDHILMHEGGRLFSGIKYAIRTDVMYTRVHDPTQADSMTNP
eukprot:scaffold73_cov118-Cylindrotheca_fusiformis.AAC.3